MKILVCGGRDFHDYAKVKVVLDEIHAKTPINCIVHGAARGADSLAHEWALRNNIEVRPYPAQWTRYGNSAGPRRNRQMLDEESPIDLVIAFPGGRGTTHMVSLALACKIPTRLV